MKFGLTDPVINQICSIIKKYPEIKKVIIYGSRATDSYKKSSDIDLTLLGDNIRFETLARVLNEIDDLLLPYQFDISIFKYLDNDNLIKHIKKYGKVFFER